MRHLHVRGRPSDCEECPATKKMRGEGDFVVKMEMEEVGKGVDQSTDSVEFLSFHNNSDSEVEVNEEASVEVSIDEESNKRWAGSRIIVLNIY